MSEEIKTYVYSEWHVDRSIWACVCGLVFEMGGREMSVDRKKMDVEE